MLRALATSSARGSVARVTRRGQATVEFALILIPLLILVVGIIQFGIGLNFWLDEQRIANQGARFAVVNAWPGCPRGEPVPLAGATARGRTRSRRTSASRRSRRGSKGSVTINICYPDDGDPIHCGGNGGHAGPGGPGRAVHVPSDHEARHAQPQRQGDHATRAGCDAPDRSCGVHAMSARDACRSGASADRWSSCSRSCFPCSSRSEASVIGIGNWYTHAKHLQTKADAAAFAGGGAWDFPCGASGGPVDQAIEAQARAYVGPHTDATGTVRTTRYNPQVGGVSANKVHVVLNGPDWYDNDSNPGATDWTSPTGSVCQSSVLDVKVTEDDSLPARQPDPAVIPTSSAKHASRSRRSKASAGSSRSRCAFRSR